MKDNPKLIIDKEKVGQAGAILKQIAQLITQYDKVYKELTPVERNIVGGLIISLDSPAEGIKFGGAVGTINLTIGLINELTAKVNIMVQKSQQEKPSQQSITPAKVEGLPN